MNDDTYPEGVTASMHIAHDIRMGRFPEQSSIATFLAERAAKARASQAEALSTDQPRGEWVTDIFRPLPEREAHLLRAALYEEAPAPATFKPRVIVNEEAGITEAVFEDVPYIAEPVFEGVYHWMDKHVAMDDGRLVGFAVWKTAPATDQRKTVLRWEKCNCGSEHCKLEYPTNLGQFYQGTGFEPEEKAQIEAAFAALAARETVTDARPANCRFRLQDEGKAYPRSGCKACGRTITTGLGRRCHLEAASVSEAKPVAWLHEITEPGAETSLSLLSKRSDNPWSHWLSEHLAECIYKCTPLYLHPRAEGEPVAWTGSGSLARLEAGGEGYIYREKADAHPIPLYAFPQPERLDRLAALHPRKD